VGVAGPLGGGGGGGRAVRRGTEQPKRQPRAGCGRQTRRKCCCQRTAARGGECVVAHCRPGAADLEYRRRQGVTAAEARLAPAATE